MTIPAHLRRPNDTLRAARQSLHMSQADFARAIRQAGDALGQPNGCTKRLVQKWESGEHAVCRPHYRKALERATGRPYSGLGFADGDQTVRVTSLSGSALAPAQVPSPLNVAAAATAGEAGDRLRYALERPVHADPDAVSLLEVTTAHLFDREHHEPARLLLPVVTRHLDDVAVMLAGTSREVLRQRLTMVGGQTAALAGLLAFHQGDALSAHHYWDAALAAARKAESGPLLACVLTYMRSNDRNLWIGSVRAYPPE